MLTRVLDRLCAEVRPLTLVGDPDGILADEVILAELNARGFRLITETDPVALRHRYHQLEPITTAGPVIVITPAPLSRLPYDLWQSGQHVVLALHTFFPNLDYPTLRLLSPSGRSRLAQVQATGDLPEHPLSPIQTTDFLLSTVFDARAELLRRPAGLLFWLARYHDTGDPLPAPLAERLLTQLRGAPDLADWPVGDIITDPTAFRRFIQDAWGDSVGHLLGESMPDGYETAPAALDFMHNSMVQDTVPALVRAGALAPVTVDRAVEVPVWAQPAIAVNEEAARVRQLAEVTDALSDQLALETLRWGDWDVLSRRWAQLNVWRGKFDARLPDDLFQRIAALQKELDDRFETWLAAHYTPLAARPLPPHHLWHVPTWLEHRYDIGRQRIALLVLDGMAWPNWLLIREAWEARHRSWKFAETSVLAQVPSITSVSRQALICGRRPIDFPETLAGNAAEPQGWAAFWRRAGLPADAITLAYMSEHSQESYPPIVDSRRIQAICLVNPAIDDMVHGATLGLSDVVGSVQVWLRDSQLTERTIEALLRNHYAVTVTSDHGHVAAIGMGQPSEGVTVASRGKRARLYNNEDFALTVQAQYPETVLWHGDDILPPGWWALMPKKRQAFVTEGAQVVSHGGTTFEELIVPLVTITE